MPIVDFTYKPEYAADSTTVRTGGIAQEWQKVDPNTTLKDIQWIKPKPKVKRQETVIKTFKSGSSDAVYTTKYYPTSGKYFCDCPGSWRSFGNCKHIKQMRNETLL